MTRAELDLTLSRFPQLSVPTGVLLPTVRSPCWLDQWFWVCLWIRSSRGAFTSFLTLTRLLGSLKGGPAYSALLSERGELGARMTSCRSDPYTLLVLRAWCERQVGRYRWQPLLTCKPQKNCLASRAMRHSWKVPSVSGEASPRRPVCSSEVWPEQLPRLPEGREWIASWVGVGLLLPPRVGGKRRDKKTKQNKKCHHQLPLSAFISFSSLPSPAGNLLVCSVASSLATCVIGQMESFHCSLVKAVPRLDRTSPLSVQQQHMEQNNGTKAVPRCCLR